MNKPLGGDEIREQGGRKVFHYDAQERLAMRSSQPGVPKKTTWLRGNRSLIITLIDIVIVVILFIIYLVFLRPMAGTEKLGPFTVSGSVFRYDDELLVSLSIVSREKPDDPSPVFPRHVTLTVQNEEIVDLLPGPGESETVRFRLPDRSFDKNGEVLRIAVQIGTETGSVSIPVSSE